MTNRNSTPEIDFLTVDNYLQEIAGEGTWKGINWLCLSTLTRTMTGRFWDCAINFSYSIHRTMTRDIIAVNYDTSGEGIRSAHSCIDPKGTESQRRSSAHGRKTEGREHF